METVEVLKKIRAMCKKADGCRNCAFKRPFCDIVPDHWTDAEIEEMAKAIDNYKEDQNV